MLVSLIALVLAQASPDSFSPATPTNLGNWLDSDEYPTRAAGLDQSGVTQADIFVGPDGKPQACYVAVSSGVTDLDGQACGAAMKRGRFKPATDDAGNPTNGVYRFRAIWVMVDRTRPKLPADVTLSVSKLPEGGTSARVTLKYLVDETGRITRCAVSDSSGSPKFDQLACRAMPARYSFSPARDAAGKAWPVVRTQSVGFELDH